MIVVESALKPYRVMAYIVGVMLLLLCVAMVVKYGFDSGTLVAVVGPIHGFLYMIYLLAALNLGLKTRWPLKYLLLVLIAGTIPFLSFVVEKNVTVRVNRQIEAAAAAA
ncbi:DUF3817 domain-containing protein [Microtetraspora sp. NBRC 16547]|uniref:DUF3817 domain-containing protein n=1 Tax=Microtetraspora sp. NBRC 16547 TaxID=3030993 RepID=UPI0024A39669|nr:DUF3817 domain-containing protein [Microtetraspora sp. NBRC 16547]GLX03015.1 membrane protein [Microtetraspora sp. NBRC 16547]